MNYITKFISNFKLFYNDINPATLTGAIDVVVVRQEDGSYLSSPFHVRFGKIGVLRSKEKVVDIEINGEPVDIHMKLGETGEAFFVEELEEGDEVSASLGTSPLQISRCKLRPEDDQRSQDSGVDADDHLEKRLANRGPLPLSFNEAGTIGEIEPKKLVVDNIRLTGSVIDSSVDPDVGIVVTRTMPVRDRTLTRDVEMQTTNERPIPILDRSHGCDGHKTTSDSDASSSHKNKRKLIYEMNQKNNLTRDSKTDSEDVVKSISRSIKRKRKKRAYSKKRTVSSNSHSSDNSTTSEVADLVSLNRENSSTAADAIFTMEDVDSSNAETHSNMLSNTTIASSTSMPLLHEKSSVVLKKDDWNKGMSRCIAPYQHPFSDTDLSPPPSPSSSRPPTPIKSDTEYENERSRSDLNEVAAQTDAKWSWQWGQLPTPPPKTPTARRNSSKCHTIETQTSPKSDDDSTKLNVDPIDPNRSMLGGVFSFMRSTKKARHNPESEGIYLDDLNLDDLDPEIAALYFPRSNFKVTPESSAFTRFEAVGARDEDVESGNGPSLPHSPHSVEGAIGGPKTHSDSESEEPRHPIFDYRGFTDLAFSRCGSLNDYMEGSFPDSLFMQSVITYDEFIENPSFLYSPDLVVRVNGKYMNWQTAAPQVMSLVLYQRPLPQKLIVDLEKDHMPKKETRKRTESKGYSWFSWRRNNQIEGEENDEDEMEEKTITPLTDEPAMPNEQTVIKVTNAQTQTLPEEYVAKLMMNGSRTRSDSSESDDDKLLDSNHKERFKKSLRLTKERIAKLKLHDGNNEGVFSITTAYQGTTRCKCNIFLWNHDEKIVISDIDGTITKSDVLGHILPIIGRDWAQSGVAQLFTKIKNNGYHFLYLSARAIGQASITRDYLKSLKQGDLSLPDGPLLLNPTSLVNAFHREVIEKKPEEFKISCLSDIQALFPKDRNPFYAGYGNRINDVYAYRAVGIPMSRIFTINHKGELRHELTQTFQSSYIRQSRDVDGIFPPIDKKMVPRELLIFMYSDSEGSNDSEEEGIVDDFIDSDWEGFPTAVDAIHVLGTA